MYIYGYFQYLVVYPLIDQGTKAYQVYQHSLSKIYQMLTEVLSPYQTDISEMY